MPIVRRLDRAFVGERVEQRAAPAPMQRDAVRRPVLGIDLDDEVRAGRERAGERPAQVLGAGAAVDEDERHAAQVGRARAGVVDLDEAAAVGADLVVVDLVDHELGPRAEAAVRPPPRTSGRSRRRSPSRPRPCPACRRSSCTRSRPEPRSRRSSRHRPGAGRADRTCRADRAARPRGPASPCAPAGPAGPCTFQLSACSERLHTLPAEGTSSRPDLCRQALISPSSTATTASRAGRGLVRDPLRGQVVRLAAVLDRADLREQVLEGGRPVLLGAEQQADQMGTSCHRKRGR